MDRFVLSLTPKNGVVFDPFAGVASAGVAAILHNRRFCGCEIDEYYVEEGAKRINDALSGNARYRSFDKPLYDHTRSSLSKEPKRHASG